MFHRLTISTMKFMALTVLLFLFATDSFGQETTCSTPTGRTGTCINIERCQSILSILTGPRPLPQQSLDFLKTLQCGFDGNLPKVCCENEQPTTITPTASTDTNEVSTTPSAPPDVTTHRNLQLLDHVLCGPITQGRIIGGHKTGIFDFPWMALIAYKIDNKSHQFRCGGSVINKRYVLTAAHCVTQLPDGLVLSGVRLGDHDISKETDCDKDENGFEFVCAEKYQDFGIDSYDFHSDYSRSTLENDIALIRLDNDVDFRPASVRPICLPIGSAATIAQTKVTVTGWGATENGTRSQDLLRVTIGLVPNDQCASIYRNNAKIGYKQMCAGGSSNMDSCFGDSGGPLQSPALYNNNPKYVQHGIVSFGPTRCGLNGFPGVYTRLLYYVDWILDTIKP